MARTKESLAIKKSLDTSAKRTLELLCKDAGVDCNIVKYGNFIRYYIEDGEFKADIIPSEEVYG